MFARFWSSFENGLRAYCLRVGESKLLPFAFKIAYFGGFTFALALACMTLLIPTNPEQHASSSSSEAWSWEGASCGIVGAVLGLSAKPPPQG